MIPTSLALEDQLKLISGDPRQILNNKMTPKPNKTFCNSLIFKDKITEITTQWIKWEVPKTNTKEVNNKTGTTITEISNTKIEEEVEEMAKVEVVTTNNVEVITTIIRTWINNIILMQEEEGKECKSKEVVRWEETCLNHQCKTQDKLIHSKWTCNSSSQTHHSKLKWVIKLSFCHKLTSPNFKPWLVNKSLNSLETASTDLFNKPSEKSLLQELLVCSLMRTLELISNSF